MALQFPTNPSVGDIANGFTWNGTAWERIDSSGGRDILPDQTGHRGDNLESNGVTANWFDQSRPDSKIRVYTDNELSKLGRRIKVTTEHPDPIDLYNWPIVAGVPTTTGEFGEINGRIEEASSSDLEREVVDLSKGVLNVRTQTRATTSDPWVDDRHMSFESYVRNALSGVRNPPPETQTIAVKVRFNFSNVFSWNLAAGLTFILPFDHTVPLSDVLGMERFSWVARWGTIGHEDDIYNSNFIAPSTVTPAPYGATRFRIWAPTADAVALKTSSNDVRLKGKFHFTGTDGSDVTIDISSVLPATANEVTNDGANNLLRAFDLVFDTGSTIHRPVGDVEIFEPGKLSFFAFPTVGTLTDAATIDWDVNDVNIATVTLGGNRILGNPTNLEVGTAYMLTVIQDATGSRTLQFSGNYQFAGGNPPTLSPGANARDALFFVCHQPDKLLMTGILKGIS